MTTEADPPIVDVQVRNPVTYLKLWWNRVMANEGVDFRFHIRPITAVLIALAIGGAGFGIGKINFPRIPFINYEINPTPTPAPSDWRETALSGKLNVTPNTNRYYLVTTSTEAVTLQFNQNLDLAKYVGRRILVSGQYNKSTHTLIIADVLDLEILPPTPQTVPVLPPTPTPMPSLTPMPTPLPLPTEIPSPTP